MKNKFKIALIVQHLVKEGYEIYFEDSQNELVIEKDGEIASFKTEAKFQEWINNKYQKEVK